MASGPYDSATDEELMAAHVRGEAGAYEALFRRRAPDMLRLVRRHLDDQDMGRDIVQQTFVRLHTARHDFRQGARLRPWLNTIAMNLVREQYRRRKVRKEGPLVEEQAPAAETGPLPLERAQEAQRLRSALTVLPDAQREVVVLHWFEEKTFAQVAIQLGSTEGAVRVRAHRAYTRLRQLLAEPEHE